MAGAMRPPKVQDPGLGADRRRLRPFVRLVAVVAALGGLIFGYDLGGSGGSFVMQGFREHFGWPWPPGDVPTPEVAAEEGWINALFTLGAMAGAVPAGTLADALGRRHAIGLAALLFTGAAGLQAGAVGMPMMYAGRFLGGVAIGVLSAVVPVYIGECSPDHFRGQLTTLWQLAITAGIVLASLLNIPLSTWDEGWRVSYGGNAVFSGVLFAMMALVMPESPRWLVARGRNGDAEAVLGRLRHEGEVAPELAEIEGKALEEEAAGRGSWLDLARGGDGMAYRTLLGAGLQALQQLSGINAIMFFAPQLLSRFFSPAAALWGALAINAVNFLGTFVTWFQVDSAGRVSLLVAGGASMAAAHAVVAALASLPETEAVGVAVVAVSCVFVVSFAYSWGPVVWTVCSEMFPLRLRGKAVSVSTATNWACATVVGKAFPLVSAPTALDLDGTFALFACICAVGTVLIYLLLPETANASLEEVDAIFRGHRPAAARRFWAEASRNDRGAARPALSACA